MGEHQKEVMMRNGESHIYKNYRDTRGHKFHFEGVQVLATEKLEHPRKLLEGMYTRIIEITFHKYANVPTYYQVIRPYRGMPIR